MKFPQAVFFSIYFEKTAPYKIFLELFIITEPKITQGTAPAVNKVIKISCDPPLKIISDVPIAKRMKTLTLYIKQRKKFQIITGILRGNTSLILEKFFSIHTRKID